MENKTLYGIGSRLRHLAYGEGVVIRLLPVAYEVCFTTYGIKQVGKDYDKWEVIEALEAEEAVTWSEAEKGLMRILRQWSDYNEKIQIADKFKNGNVLLQPFDKSLQAKEVPMDTFFNKIVLIRERLRVLEQKLNNHDGLSNADKVELQQYITRCYGSLTTFNVLFQDKKDYFVGEKK